MGYFGLIVLYGLYGFYGLYSLLYVARLMGFFGSLHLSSNVSSFEEPLTTGQLRNTICGQGSAAAFALIRRHTPRRRRTQRSLPSPMR